MKHTTKIASIAVHPNQLKKLLFRFAAQNAYLDPTQAPSKKDKKTVLNQDHIKIKKSDKTN